MHGTKETINVDTYLITMENRTRDSLASIVTKQDDLYCLTAEVGTYGLSRNIDMNLLFCAE
jgi:hypothetical protein